MNWVRRSDTLRAGAGYRARIALFVLLLGLGARGARAGDVSVTVDDSLGTYRIHGTFDAPVSGSVAWDVLTDYDHISDYVKSVRSSVVEQRGAGWVVLRQDARGGFFPIRRTVHVRLEVKETGETRITFTDLLGRDFRRYSGEWVIRPGSPGTSVSYSLEASPTAGIPLGLGRGIMGREARELLEQVRKEMVRRAAAQSTVEGRAL